MATTLKDIAASKEKLQKELEKLEEQEANLRAEKAAEAFKEITDLLGQYSEFLSRPQKNEIAAIIGVGTAPKARKASSDARKEVAPKYWLPHTGETWTGRGRTPKAFSAWEGTAAYNDWKKNHPEEKFPKFPG